MIKSTLVAMLIAIFTSQTFASQQDVELALENKDIDAAELAYEKISTNEKETISGQVLLSRILMAKDDTEAAYDLLEALRDENKNNLAIEYNFGRSAVVMAQKASIFSKLGYAEDFLEAMENTVALDPKHVEALDYLIGFHLGAPSIAGGDTEKALSYAKQVKTIDAEKGYGQMANVYFQTEKIALAQQTITAGIAEFPESGQLYLSRASAYMKDEAWEKARPDLILAAKFAKDDGEKSRALYQQGKVSAESGLEISAGIDALIHALPIADEQYQPWVKYRLAQLYTHNKEVKKAKDLIVKINIDDDDDLKSKVKKLKKKLKKLKA